MVPSNIDMAIQANVDKLIYTNIELKNLSGKVLVQDQKVILENTTANALGGQVGIEGGYDTTDPENPAF